LYKQSNDDDHNDDNNDNNNNNNNNHAVDMFPEISYSSYIITPSLLTFWHRSFAFKF